MSFLITMNFQDPVVRQEDKVELILLYFIIQIMILIMLIISIMTKILVIIFLALCILLIIVLLMVNH